MQAEPRLHTLICGYSQGLSFGISLAADVKLLKFIASSLLVLSVLAGSAAAAQRPNILFVFIDDSGWGDFSCYGSPVTNKLGQPITPNLDRLASQGIRFTQGYVAYPICSPSRTAVLTGIEPARYAIYSFLNNKTNNAARNMADWVQPDTVTAPRLFQQAGYATGQFGKWHMGNGRDVNNAPPPATMGSTNPSWPSRATATACCIGMTMAASTVFRSRTRTPRWALISMSIGTRPPASTPMPRWRSSPTPSMPGKPFYVHVPYNDTHSPYNVPPGQENDFDHITTDTDAKLFLGELHNLDKQIGRLVQARLTALGIGNNTLMVVVGDNGAPNDAIETILNRNGGLRGGKGNLYEGGIREAFLIRWPGTVPAGVVNSNTVVSTLDLLPTYCAFAGIRAAQRAVRRART